MRTSAWNCLKLLFIQVCAVTYCLEDGPSTVISYEGYTVVEATGLSRDGVVFIRDFLDENYDIVQLHEDRTRDAMQLAVPPGKFKLISDTFASMNLTLKTQIEDLSRLIPHTNNLLRKEPLPHGQVTFDQFMSYDQIEGYVKAVAERYPQQISRKVIGRSNLGKELHMLIITNKNVGGTNKAAVMIDGGIHAREWISPASVMYVVERLLESPALLNNIEWRIIPVLNPDGYIYSWEKDRLWRKNRSKGHSTKCHGTDLNRNFDFHWMESGSSTRPCSEVYAGKHAFSEPESKALRDAVLSANNRVKAYISVHSYGQMILHPWGYTNSASHPNEKQLKILGDKMAAAIHRKTGSSYNVNSAGAGLYTASGGSDDYMAGGLHIPISYTFEMRDKGTFGFILPDSQIRESGEELWAAITILGRDLLRKYGPAKYRNDLNETQRTSNLNEEPANIEKVKEEVVIQGPHQYHSLVIPILHTDGVLRPSVYLPTPVTHYEVPHLVVPGATWRYVVSYENPDN